MIHVVVVEGVNTTRMSFVEIETVEGLETLAKLRILWIGGNRIESIPPGAFDSNECLTVIFTSD